VIPFNFHARRYSNRIFAVFSLAFFLAGSSASADDIAVPLQPPLLSGKGISVYAAGDIADCSILPPEYSFAGETAELIAARLADDSEAVVLTLGDNAYPDGTPADFADCYEPTWGRLKARTYPSLGNHDYTMPEAVGYFSYFGAMAGPAGRGYYSFNVGNWHVISLNSNLNPAEHKDQLEWLNADLQSNPTACMLAYWHHPLYSSGENGNNPKMADVWAVLHVANADLVLVAHDHNYERFAPLDANGQRNDQFGIRQFVVGTGGAWLRRVRPGTPNSEASDSLTFGVLKLVLKDNGYEWEFLPTANGRFTDQGAAFCH
jgi:hypothetical protein